MALYLGVAAVGLLALLLLQPKVKALVSYFLMMQSFNLAPAQLFGMYVWDYGAILMLVTAGEVFLFRQAAQEPGNRGYLTALKVFVAWLFICFSWSLLIYQYPILHTIKSARYMVLGYSMTLIFIRLFSVQPDTFEFLMKWFYRLTFALMPLCVLQYILHKPLLFAPVGDYEGALRAIPTFLPLCLLNFWIILAKVFSSERLAVHEWVYAALVLMTVALTYTRGIYIGVIFTIGVLVWTLSRDRMLNVGSAVIAALAAALMLIVLVASGAADKVGGRVLSGLQLLSTSAPTSGRTRYDDTFTGRLGLAAERFSLVWAQNPIVGFGFLHEEDVPAELRSNLKYGTPVGGTAGRFDSDGHYVLGLYTSDIAWADIVISTGWIGVALLITFMLTLIFGHYLDREIAHPMGYAVRNGLFLQLLMLFLLMFDGDAFYNGVQIPAFLLAGYSLTRARDPAKSILPAMRTRPPNLMK